MDALRQFPSIWYMEQRARRRIPRFCWEYLAGGAGRGAAVEHNRAALDAIRFVPRFLDDRADRPALSVELLGRRWDAPFGIAPIGLGGLVWPGAAEHLAAAARRRNIPFVMSSYATVSLERIAEIAPEHAWFQLYAFNEPEMDHAIVTRAERAGFDVLVVTVDLPTATRRAHDVRNGLSVPPRMTLANLAQMAVRPRWALAMARAGIPRFHTLLPHVPPGLSLADLGARLARLHEGHMTREHLKALRDLWPRRMVVKGLYHPSDVEDCRRLGVDGVVISNHGGRHLEGVPSSIEMLAQARPVAGDMALMADGGVRSGLDVARFAAAGADAVLCGRAFMFGIAAMGARGGDHVAELLASELRQAMVHIGAPTLGDLAASLHLPGD